MTQKIIDLERKIAINELYKHRIKALWYRLVLWYYAYKDKNDEKESEENEII